MTRVEQTKAREIAAAIQALIQQEGVPEAVAIAAVIQARREAAANLVAQDAR